MGQHRLEAAAGIGWLGWILSHLAQINEVLQFFVLILSAAVTGIALWRAIRKK